MPQAQQKTCPVCTTLFVSVLHTTARNTVIPENCNKSSNISAGVSPVAPLPLLLKWLSCTQLMQAVWATFSLQARIYLQPIYCHLVLCQQGLDIFSSSESIFTPHCECISVRNPYQLSTSHVGQARS